MAKKITGYVKLQVPAGAANPSPPIGPALGQRADVIVADVVTAASLPGGERALPHPGVGGLVVHTESVRGLTHLHT